MTTGKPVPPVPDNTLLQIVQLLEVLMVTLASLQAILTQIQTNLTAIQAKLTANAAALPPGAISAADANTLSTALTALAVQTSAMGQ